MAAALVFAAALVLAQPSAAPASKVYGTQQSIRSGGVPAGCSQLAGLLQRCEQEQGGILGAVVSSCSDLQAKLAACLTAPPETVSAGGGEERQFGAYGPDWARAEQPTSPPRRSKADGLTAAVFQREYLSKGLPVIITDAADGWPAREWCDPCLYPASPVALSPRTPA